MVVSRESVRDKVRSLDWNFGGAETQYLTHAIHRYSGKFIPQVARNAIELVSSPGDVVLDPYCGSGTTLLEAAVLDRMPVGVDVNPLAVLISDVKATPISPSRLSEFQLYLRQNLPVNGRGQRSMEYYHEQSQARTESGEKQDSHGRLQDPWFLKWFQPHALKGLMKIEDVVNGFPDDSCRKAGLLGLSDILRRCSNAHGSYPNVMFHSGHRVAPDPVPVFLSRIEEICDAMEDTFPILEGKPFPEVVRGDARNLPLRSGSVDAIVTHPPYVASIPYAEYGVLSLRWFGVDTRLLTNTLLGGPRSSSGLVERFRSEYAKCFGEFARVLQSGGRMFLLVGSPVVHGQRVDLSSLTTAVAEENGFDVEVIAYRDGMNRRANLMGRETLVFLRKS